MSVAQKVSILSFTVFRGRVGTATAVIRCEEGTSASIEALQLVIMVITQSQMVHGDSAVLLQYNSQRPHSHEARDEKIGGVENDESPYRQILSMIRFQTNRLMNPEQNCEFKASIRYMNAFISKLLLSHVKSNLIVQKRIRSIRSVCGCN